MVASGPQPRGGSLGKNQFMTRDKKIIIGCVVAFVLFGLCACCGFGFLGTSLFGAAMGPGMEGAQVGQATYNHEDCITASFARADRCPAMDVSCGFEVGAFEGGCLASVPADRTAFCQASAGVGAEAFCTQRGRASANGCEVVYNGQQDFCQP
jgi:hypothetical protein